MSSYQGLVEGARGVSERVENTAPYGNTGALNTCSGSSSVGPSPQVSPKSRVKFDWLGVTFQSLGHDEHHLQGFISLMGWESLGFVKLDVGFRGYPVCYRAGHIMVATGASAAMGIHVEISGQGFGELEAAGIVDDWQLFFRNVFDFGVVHFSRLDVAWDCFDGSVSWRYVLNAIESGRVVHRSKSYEVRYRTTFGGEYLAQGLNVGTRSSNSYARFYDKFVESPDLAREMGVESWDRWELELKNEVAGAVAAAFAVDGWQVVREAANGFLRVVVPSGDSNKSRWEIDPVWAAFIGADVSVSYTGARRAASIESRKVWLERQVGKSLALVADYLKVREGWVSFIEDLMADGRKKFKGPDLGLLSLGVGS